MSTPRLAFTRRRALVGAAALLALGVAASACTPPPPPPDTDDLDAQLASANSDSELATAAAAATAARAPVTVALIQVANERSSHARALTDEIARTLGFTATTTAQASETSSATTTSAAPAPAPTVRDVVMALQGSARSAADLAATESGYRAGLLGSIAAACTAAASVGLAVLEPGP